MKKLYILSVILIFQAAPSAADDSLSYEGKVSSGGVESVGILAFEISTDDGSIVAAGSGAAALTAQAEASLALAPAWIRADLRDLCSRVSQESQDAMAEQLLALDDPRLIDEVAFTFARLSPEIVERSRSHLDAAVENARWIYQVDADLDYVEVVDVGNPAADDDFYTTTRYRVMDGGAEVSYTLPQEMYYWYIVHPILDCAEWFYRIAPRTGLQSASGEWWRTFYYEDDETSDYVRPYVLVQPNEIDDAYLASADFGGPAAASFFTGPARSMSTVVRQTGSRMPAFVSFVHGDGRCCDASYPNPDGQVFATTIPVEAAALAGEGELLENMLRAGTGNRELRLDVLLSDNLGNTAPRKVLILRDRNPFDAASDPNETALAAFGWDVDVLPSADLDALVLTTSEAPFVPSDYVKIVVPSDQPLDLYRALSASAAKIEQFVDMGGVFELHGAVRPADDWTALPAMPFGLAALPMDGAHGADDVEAAGFPLLKEIIEDTPYLWDRQKVILPGERAFDPGEGAVAKIGWWTANSLPWRVQEMATWRRNPVIERSSYPARILYNHFGNCGEIQDVYGAAMRTLLVPCALMGTMADDHAWNEFYENDEWHPLQVDWSGSVTQIDNWGVAYDADTGGGKTIAGMTMTRPDCMLNNVLGRYEPEIDTDGIILSGDYSFYVTLRLTVVDREGKPVDGARILIATPGLYDPSSLSAATWAFTGKDGIAEFTVGENNAYYYQAESPIGTLPQPGYVDRLVTEAGTAEPGTVIERTIQFSGTDPATGLDFPSIPRLAVSEASYTPPGDGAEAWNVTASVSVGRELAYGHSLIDEKSWMEPAGDGALNVYLMDEADYGLLTGGMSAGAIHVAENITSDDFDLDLPTGSGKWYLVIAGPGRVTGAREVSALVETSLRSPAEELPDEAVEESAGEAEEDVEPDGGDGGEPGGEEGGCGCTLVSL
jgi:hypothetical protein